MNHDDFEQLTPGRDPFLDAFGTPADSPVRVTGRNLLITREGYGAEETLITDLELTGLEYAHTSEGMLFCEIEPDPVEDEIHVTLRRRHSSDYYYVEGVDDIARATFPAEFEGPETQPLTGIGGPSVGGTVTLLEPLVDDGIRVFVPFSAVRAVIAEDPDFVLSAVELRGVTRQNSENGVLNWVMEALEGRFELSILHGETVLAQAVIPDEAYPPCVCELAPVDGSGVRGSAVVESLEDSSGRVILRVAEAVEVRADVILPDVPASSAPGLRPLALDANGRIVVVET